MLFGLSWGEVALILGATVALLGPKDSVVIGRAAGRLTGKAVGYIQNARGHLEPIMQRSEMNAVHKEVREAMAQIEAIRHEMRTDVSLMNPGRMTSRVLGNAVPSLSADSVQSSEKEDRLGLSERAPGNQVISDVISNRVSTTQIQNLQGASKQEKPAGNDVTVGSAASAFPFHAEANPIGLASVIQVSKEPEHSEKIVGRASGQDQQLVVLPISAVEAGLLPSNQEPISGGSDIVLASIVERKVAFQSRKFLVEEGN